MLRYYFSKPTTNVMYILLYIRFKGALLWIVQQDQRGFWKERQCGSSVGVWPLQLVLWLQLRLPWRRLPEESSRPVHASLRSQSAYHWLPKSDHPQAGVHHWHRKREKKVLISCKYIFMNYAAVNNPALTFNNLWRFAVFAFSSVILYLSATEPDWISCMKIPWPPLLSASTAIMRMPKALSPLSTSKLRTVRPWSKEWGREKMH